MNSWKNFAIFLIVSILLFTFIGKGLTSSPTKEFNITPDLLLINWTYGYTGNLTVTSNVNYNFSVKVDNSTSYFLFFNYTNLSRPSTCSITEISDTSYCVWFLVVNETGYYNNSGELTIEHNSINFTIVINSTGHPPGRYRGFIIITNTSSENASLETILDIEVKPDQNGIGQFEGILPANSTQYHSFFFNTSSIENATSIKVNLTSSSNLHIFLFGNGLKGKSISNSLTKNIFYQHLTPLEFWEIRIYGNESNGIEYSGDIIFSTLNSSISALNYGTVNTSNKTRMQFNLTNVGNLIHQNVSQNLVLYLVRRFNASEPRNFSFLVPDEFIASKIIAKLVWKGDTNYSLVLRSPSDAIFQSLNKHTYAKAVGAEKEEFVEAPVEKGYWKAEVKNYSQPSEYNLTIYIQLKNASKWIKTNYSSFTFNKRGEVNSSVLIEVNFTAQENSLNGNYEGYLEYLDVRGSGIRIPIKFNLTAPLLIVDNTINSSTIKITENINANLTKVLDVPIKNEGNYDLTNLTFLSSNFLNCSSNPTKFIRISELEVPSNLSTNETSSINITLQIRTNETNDRVCIYKGWVFISTNESEYPAIPYKAFNLTLEINLTDRIIANVTGIETADGDNWINFTSSPEDVIVKYLNLFYINGTQIKGNLVYFENLTEVRLRHKNLTSYYVPRAGNLNTTNYSSFEDPPNSNSGNYIFNFTVPENELGGIYQVLIGIKTADGKLEGTANNGELIINNTALHLQPSDCSSISMRVGESRTCGVRVRNYGPLKATTANLEFITSCSHISVNTSAYNGLGIDGFDYEGRVFGFKITGVSNGTCNAWINITNAKWYEDSAIQLTISVTPQPSEEGGENVTYTLPTFVVDLNFTRAENLITIEQNSTNSTVVIVKNTGNITADINFSIEGINSTWFSVNSSNATLKVGKEAAFLVNFSIGKEKMEDYAGKFKVVGKNSLWNLEKTITSDFTLRVLPSEETKKWVNETLASLNQNVSLFASQISELKKRNYNTTLAEVLLLELIKEIEEAENYTKKGDYRTAYYLLDDLISLAEKVADEIKNAKQIIQQKEEEERARFQFTTILIASGAGAAIVLVYLFWPVKPKKFYVLKPPKPIKGTEIWRKLKERWDKLFEARIKTKRKKR